MDAEVERECSSQTQQTWLSKLMMYIDCIGDGFLVMQSFLDMLDSEHEDPALSAVAHQDASSRIS